VELKLNGTHQLLAYAYDVNLLCDNIVNTNKNTETLIDANKWVGIEIDAEKLSTCCCFVTKIMGKLST
jgi:hypothetical protein